MTSAELIHSTHADDYESLHRIRQKFQIVFGNTCTLKDDILRKRYRVSSDGDLVMIIS
jgi:hypothetical protein